MTRVKSTSNVRISITLYIILACIFILLKAQRAFVITDRVGGIWNIIQVFFVASGMFFLLKMKKLHHCIVWFVLYSILAVVISILHIDELSINSGFSLMKVPYGAMVCVGFYYVGHRLCLDREKVTLLKITFYLASAIVISNMLEFRAINYRSGAIADVYYVLALLPLVLTFTNTNKQIIPIIVVCVAVLLTGKRAGMIALATALIFFYLIIALKSNSVWRFAKTIILFMIMIAVLLSIFSYVNNKYNLQIIERLARLTYDGGSGRAERWSRIWHEFLDSSLVQILFGHGNMSVYRQFGGHAHNDFLQVLYEYGIFAFVFYIGLYLSLMKTNLKMYRANYPHAAAFNMSIIISLILASFSFYVIDATYITSGSLTWGLLLADWQKYKRKPILAHAPTKEDNYAFRYKESMLRLHGVHEYLSTRCNNSKGR